MRGLNVIIFPHVGGTAQSQVNGMAMTGRRRCPHRRPTRRRTSVSSIRPTISVAAWASRVWRIAPGSSRRAARSSPKDRRRPSPGVHGDQRRDGGDAGATVRPRLDSPAASRAYAKARCAYAAGTPTCGLLRPVPVLNATAAHARRVHRVLGGAARPTPASARTSHRTRVPVHISSFAAEDAAAAAEPAAPVGIRRRRSPADGTPVRHQRQQSRPRGGDYVPAEPQRHAAVGTLANGRFLSNHAALVDVGDALAKATS